MISLDSFGDLSTTEVGTFKPTTLIKGQTEALTKLRSSPNGRIDIGVWECTPGHFTADRRAVGEYCHIIAGRATVMNANGTNPCEIGPGDLLVLRQIWKGKWTILKHMCELFIMTTSGSGSSLFRACGGPTSLLACPNCA